jgi:hypothetical protein
MTHRYTQMNPEDALSTLARNFPDGLPKLASLMGLSHGVLRNKVSTYVKTHYTSVREFSEIMHICREAGVADARHPLAALNWEHDMVAFASPIPEALTEAEASQIVCRVMKEFGELAAVVSDAMADGKITLQEMDNIQCKFQRALAAMGQWRKRVEDRFSISQTKEQS